MILVVFTLLYLASSCCRITSVEKLTVCGNHPWYKTVKTLALWRTSWRESRWFTVATKGFSPTEKTPISFQRSALKTERTVCQAKIWRPAKPYVSSSESVLVVVVYLMSNFLNIIYKHFSFLSTNQSRAF